VVFLASGLVAMIVVMPMAAELANTVGPKRPRKGKRPSRRRGEQAPSAGCE
jgi:hypothetical protein